MGTDKKGYPIIVDETKCAGCLICELRCSLRFENAFNPSKARIAIRKLVDAETEYAIAIAPDCDNCGICARYCFYGALTQQKKGG